MRIKSRILDFKFFKSKVKFLKSKLLVYPNHSTFIQIVISECYDVFNIIYWYS